MTVCRAQGGKRQKGRKTKKKRKRDSQHFKVPFVLYSLLYLIVAGQWLTYEMVSWLERMAVAAACALGVCANMPTHAGAAGQGHGLSVALAST